MSASQEVLDKALAIRIRDAVLELNDASIMAYHAGIEVNYSVMEFRMGLNPLQRETLSVKLNRPIEV